MGSRLPAPIPRLTVDSQLSWRLVSTAMTVTARKLVFDIESRGPIRPRVMEEHGHAYDLVWIDAAYAEAGAEPVAEFERKRRFKHAGAAIAWARRQIFHGKVFGEQIEMHAIRLYTVDDEPNEVEVSVTDITLAGFQEWKDRDYSAVRAVSLGKPIRKCRAAAHQ
jgi:hypothetical protein